MKFGTGADAVNAIDFNLSYGYKAPSDPYSDSVQVLTFVDETTEVINFGSRISRVASFEFVHMERDNALILHDYLQTKLGQKIEVEETRSGEKIFTDSWTATDYYCRVVEFGSLTEEGFSTSRKLFKLRITLALTGVNSTDELNPADSSLIDALIEFDTIQANYSQTSPPTGSKDERWFKSDDRDLYKHNGDQVNAGLDDASWDFSTKTLTQTGKFASYTHVEGNYIRILGGSDNVGLFQVASKVDDDSIILYQSIQDSDLTGGVLSPASSWDLLYAVAPNDSTYGFIDGVFYWSLFSDISKDVGNGIPELYKSGLIKKDSLNIQGKGIDLNKGPSIAYRQGFSYSVDNSQKFWKFIISNKIPVSGSKSTLKFYKNDGSKYITKWMTGKNLSNQFTYSDYQFEIEPSLLNDNSSLQITTIQDGVINGNDERYVGVKESVIGDSPILTYGEHDMALLQDISSERTQVQVTRLSDNAEVIVLTGKLDYNTADNTRVMVAKSDFTISLPDFLSLDNGNYALEIILDSTSTDDENEGEIRRVLSVDDSDVLWYAIDVTSGFPTRPIENIGPSPATNDSIDFVIQRMTVKYQQNEDDSGGFGVFINGTFNPTIELYNISDNGKQLKVIPSTEFSQNSDGSIVNLNPQSLTGNGKINTFKKIAFSDGSNVIRQTYNQISEPYLDLGFWVSPPAYMTQDHYKNTFNISMNLRNTTPTHFFSSVQKPFPNITSNTIKSIHNVFETGDIDDPTTDNENYLAHILEYNIEHRSDTVNFINSENVKIALNMKLASRILFMFNKNRFPSVVSVPGGVPTFEVAEAVGINIKLRFKKKDGTYIESNDWEYSIDKYQLGIETNSVFEYTNFGKVQINNNPNSEGGFSEDVTTLGENYKYEIRNIVADESSRDASESTQPYKNGDLIWRTDLAKFQKVSGINGNGSVNWTDDVVPNAGDVIYLTAKNQAATKVYKVISGPSIVLATANVDYEEMPIVQGRDLFDISSLFGATPVWDQVATMEVIISNHNMRSDLWPDTIQMLKNANLDIDGDYIWGTNTTTSSKNYYFRKYFLDIEIIEPPALYTIADVDISEKPTFSAVQGKILPSATFPNGPKEIIKDVLDKAYPNGYDSASVDAICDLPSRANWKWRKQFTKPVSSKAVLEEILKNLHAVAIFDNDDKIALKTLNPDDYGLGSPTLAIDDSMIIKDSQTPPKFRDTNEIFQRFELDYDFYPPSEFSNAIKPYRKKNLVSEYEGDVELVYRLKASQNLFQTYNIFKEHYNYHYSGSKMGLVPWVVKFFSLNSWRMKLKLSLSNIIGVNSLDLMDVVSLDSHFFTDNEVVRGFVTGIKPNIYKGYFELGMYIPEPPGNLGPFCDPFKDALELGSRDISGWTSDQINDAGVFPRDNSIYLKDDAQTFPRTNLC